MSIFSLFARQSFNTQPPEGGWVKNGMPFNPYKVSTHSRLKAAGHHRPAKPVGLSGFNTQPPEGGWAAHVGIENSVNVFQHTAA